MSVQYNLSKTITLNDLKNKGYRIDKNPNDEGHPYDVNEDVAISQIDEDGIIYEFEGRWNGGLFTIHRICKDFNCLYITDADIERVYMESFMNGNSTNEILITKEDYLRRAKEDKLTDVDIDKIFD